jgi:hypothetical protein
MSVLKNRSRNNSRIVADYFANRALDRGALRGSFSQSVLTLLVTKGFDRIHFGGGLSGIDPEDDADSH